VASRPGEQPKNQILLRASRRDILSLGLLQKSVRSGRAERHFDLLTMKLGANNR
jgi:hypothetical protein